MSAARDFLAAVQQRADAAEEGPWKVNDLRGAPDGNRDCIWVDVDNGHTYTTVADMDEDEGLRSVWGLAEAEFIAASRTDVPRLVAALTAVLDLHVRTDGLGIDLCAECRTVLWPCPTARAITDALTPKENDS